MLAPCRAVQSCHRSRAPDPETLDAMAIRAVRCQKVW